MPKFAFKGKFVLNPVDIFTTDTLRKIFSRNSRLWPFLICFAVAGFLWLLTSLTRPYKVYVEFDLRYENLARLGIKESNLPEKILVELEDYGYNIIGYRYRNKSHTVYIDFNDYRILKNTRRNESYILLNNHPEMISHQLSNEVKVLKIEPDTIFISAIERAGKKVPVIFKSNLTYQKQFMKAGSVRVVPDSVTISGPKSVLNKIDSIYTEILDKEGVESSFEERVKISRAGLGQEIQISPAIVKVQVKVQEFTEGVVDVPIEAVNAPPGAGIIFIPGTVKIKYRVTLDNYNKIKPTDFKVQADCHNVFSQAGDYLKLVISTSPETVSNATLTTNAVKYLIRK